MRTKKIDSIINCKDPKKADAVISGASYDRTSSYRKGANKGPKEVVSCLDRNLEFFERFTLTEPAYLFKIAYKDIGLFTRLSPEQMVEKVTSAYEQYAKFFLIMLGGSHSVSIGAFNYWAQGKKPADITIVQIDAHPDLRDDNSDYKKRHSRYADSCVMRRAYDFGFKTVQIGIREYSKKEYEFIKEKELTVFEWGKGRPPSISSIVEAILTDKVYLTIDIDGFDPSHMPATGSPVPGGLEWDYALKLIRCLFKAKEIIGADITEIAPNGKDVVTQFAAARLCYNIVSWKLLKAAGKLIFHA